MKWNRIPALAGVGCLALFMGASTVQAQSNDASAADKSFAKDAMQGGMAEVELGKLAAQKGNSEDVKQFGQKMVDDHTKLNEQMKPLASQIGVNPPDGPSMMQKASEKKLDALSGDDFDKAYIQDMLKDHRKDLAAFKKEAATGTNAGIKDAASQGSQVVAEHLKMIEQIAKAHGITGAKAKAAASPAAQ